MGIKLERFCCCCTVRTGTLVIGTAGWIFTIIEIFGVADSSRYKKKSAVEDSTNYLVYQILGALLTLTICILLIVGVYKRTRAFILPWLVLYGIQMVGVSILSLVVFVLIFIVDSALTIIFAVLFVILLISSLLSIYCWICVWSHYTDLGEEENDLRTSPAAMKMTA